MYSYQSIINPMLMNSEIWTPLEIGWLILDCDWSWVLQRTLYVEVMGFKLIGEKWGMLLGNL